MGTILVGSGGGSSDADVVRVEFAYDTPSPMILATLAAGQTIDRALILITEAFDGVGATLSLGTVAEPGLFLSAAEVAPGRLGQYETDELVPFDAAELLRLTIAPGSGATRGAGILLYKTKP